MKDTSAPDAGPDIDYGELNARIGYLLRRAQMAVFSDFYRTFSALGISPAQYSILVVIARNPGRSQSEVADALGIQKTNFVGVIKNLEKRALVLRTAMPTDRRSFALTLSPAGVSQLAVLNSEAEAHEERIRQQFGAQEYAALFEPLSRLRQLE
jgi:DNA-binding MarR family transcriptional regulator